MNSKRRRSASPQGVAANRQVDNIRRRLKKAWLIVAGGLAAFLMTGCRTPDRLTSQQAEGRHLYAVRCAHCHEDNDLGLKPAPPDVRGVLMRTKLPGGEPASDRLVRVQVLVGKGNMPGFQGRFTEPQMQALLAYLHTPMR